MDFHDAKCLITRFRGWRISTCDVDIGVTVTVLTCNCLENNNIINKANWKLVPKKTPINHRHVSDTYFILSYIYRGAHNSS